MFYKKKNKDDFANYRAICLLNHAYKLLSAVIARRLQAALEPLLPDSQAGFRPARGTRDNICILKWTINMLLQEEKPAVVTFIDYSAAFDTESQLFLDEALQAANVPIKLRRIIQSVFKAATGCVRINKPNGEQATSEAFNMWRSAGGHLLTRCIYCRADEDIQSAQPSGLWCVSRKVTTPTPRQQPRICR